ncbi:MAG: hypothetical protein O2855_06230 [Planctomycetota bacterium]|nr:hypothetical protein [Planctomycetota bacterium]
MTTPTTSSQCHAQIAEALERRAREWDGVVDAELLAVFAERGIDAVPVEHRAQILEAVGRSPELAACVVAIREKAGSAADTGVLAKIGPAAKWWMASAACLSLAAILTVWLATAGPSSTQPVTLADGTSSPPAPTIAADSEASGPSALPVVTILFWAGGALAAWRAVRVRVLDLGDSASQ